MPEIRIIAELRNTSEISDLYRKLGEAEKQLSDNVPLIDGADVLKRLRKKYAPYDIPIYRKFGK